MYEIGTKLALLQALAHSDGTCDDLLQRIESATGGRLILPRGRVYLALRELEAERLLEAYEGEWTSVAGGRPARYFRLTAAGRRTAKAQAKALMGLLEQTRLTETANRRGPRRRSRPAAPILVQRASAVRG